MEKPKKVRFMSYRDFGGLTNLVIAFLYLVMCLANSF